MNFQVLPKLLDSWLRCAVCKKFQILSTKRGKIFWIYWVNNMIKMNFTHFCSVVLENVKLRLWLALTALGSTIYTFKTKESKPIFKDFNV